MIEKNGWISTKDELPKAGERVLIVRDTRKWDKKSEVFVDVATVGYFKKKTRIGGSISLTGYYDMQGIYFAVPAILHPDSVTYWQPIPDFSDCK